MFWWIIFYLGVVRRVPLGFGVSPAQLRLGLLLFVQLPVCSRDYYALY